MLVDWATRTDLRFRVRRAVRWMSPITGLGTLIVVMVGRLRDPVASAIDPDPEPTPSPRPAADGSVWVDFVSDTGDGFAAMATVAWLLAQGQLELPDGSNTRRGSLLAHGGDMVYPSGTDRAYADRFVGPMSAMLPTVPESPPTIVAIPGNHDGHDGLESWRRLMLTGRTIGAWQTTQSEPWFATRVNDRWWLWGVDVETREDLSEAQWAYFSAMADLMVPGSSVVMIVSEPAWVRTDESGRQATYRRLVAELVEGRARSRVRLWLSGDSHHYSRYVTTSASDPVHFVIAGGGGAFLSATHSIPATTRLGDEDLEVVEASIYPAREISRHLVRRAPRLLWRNGPFPLVAALVYLIGAIALGSSRSLSALSSPSFVSFGLALVGAAWLYTADRTWRGVVVGMPHATAHGAAIVGLWWILDRSGAGGPTTLALAGAVVGPLIIGLALIAASRLGLNDNELFSSIRIDDYRSFARLRFEPDGGVVVSAIGVDRVVRRWTGADPAATSRLEPTVPVVHRLIETFRLNPIATGGD